MLLIHDQKTVTLPPRLMSRLKGALKVRHVKGEVKYVHHSASLATYIAYVSVAGGAAQAHMVPESEVTEVKHSRASV